MQAINRIRKHAVIRQWAAVPAWLLLLACAAPTHAQVVVLTHPASGDFVVVQNHPSPRTEAMQRANAKGRGGGWKQLLGSTVPGYGAMFCFRPPGGDVRYFVAEGKTTGSEAIKDARTQANAAARGSGTFTSICGNWHNRNAYPLEAQASHPAETRQASPASGMDNDGGLRKEGERGLIETLKQQVREQVACDPKQSTCPPPPKPTGTGVRG